MTYPELYKFHEPLWAILCYFELCRTVCLPREWYLPSTDLSPSRTHCLLASKCLVYQSHAAGIDIHLHQHNSPQSQTQNLHSVLTHLKRSYHPQTPKKFNITSAKEYGVVFLKRNDEGKEVPYSIPKRVAKYGVQIKRPNSIQVWVHFLPLSRTFYLP